MNSAANLSIPEIAYFTVREIVESSLQTCKDEWSMDPQDTDAFVKRRKISPTYQKDYIQRVNPSNSRGLINNRPFQERSIKRHGQDLAPIRNGSGGSANIVWPCTRDFSEDFGAAKIKEFIERTWDYDRTLLTYDIDFLYQAHLAKANYKRYKYRVCWTGPSRRSHILSSTASVYFNLDVNLAEPSAVIEITYTFQTDKVLHRPGSSEYHRKWLDRLENAELVF